MPDNVSGGMVETFCQYMIPASSESLWDFVERSCVEAKGLGADWKEIHKEKAHIHTWLAWRDPPGERMGSAIAKKILDHNAEACKPFVKWFRDLYQI